MKLLKYLGKKVYTQANTEVGIKDLHSADIKPGQVRDAYFFEITGDRMVHQIGFDREKVDALNSGLMVEINVKPCGTAAVSIAGLQRIVDFMGDFNCMGNLSEVKGKRVNTYNRGMHLLGFSKSPLQN